MRLFELTGADPEHSFSPFVWRTRLALAHKGIEAERVATRFTDKSAFEESGSKTVPVIEDEGHWVSDSWNIACYLEEKYSDAPSLFGGEIGRGQARFLDFWTLNHVLIPLFPMLAFDIYKCLGPDDQSYFRETREARLGCTLEEAAAKREEAVIKFRKGLAPLRQTLTSPGAPIGNDGEADNRPQAYICGSRPAYSDYLVFSTFLWAHCCTAFQILEDDDPINDWLSRCYALYDGLAAKAKRAA